MAEKPIIDTKAGYVETSGIILTTLIDYQVKSISDGTLSCTVIVSGKDRINDLAGGYFHFGVFKYDSTTLTKINSDVVSEFEEDLDWNIEMNVSGDSILVQVQGGAGQNVSWGGKIEIVYGTAAI